MLVFISFNKLFNLQFCLSLEFLFFYYIIFICWFILIILVASILFILLTLNSITKMFSSFWKKFFFREFSYLYGFLLLFEEFLFSIFFSTINSDFHGGSTAITLFLLVHFLLIFRFSCASTLYDKFQGFVLIIGGKTNLSHSSGNYLNTNRWHLHDRMEFSSHYLFDSVFVC